LHLFFDYDNDNVNVNVCIPWATYC
jgi:hypothetical protein